MADNVKISFYLPEKIEREVEDMVDRGVFTTKSDVYQEAVRRLLIEYRDFSIDDEVLEKVREMVD